MSSFLEDIDKVKASHVTLLIGVLLSVISPGILIIFYFWPQLFRELDTVKLVFLAISLSLPVVSINTSMLWADPKKGGVVGNFFVAMGFSFVMLYVCLLAAWYLKMSFAKFVATIAVLESIAVAISFTGDVVRGYRAKKASRS